MVPTEGYTTWSGLVQTLHRQLVMTRGVSQSVRHGDVITCQIHPLRFASCCATGTRDKFIRACAAFQHADAAPALLRVHHPFHHVLRMFRVLHVPQHRGPPPHSCAPTQACPTVRTVFPFMCVGMCTERHFGRTDTPNTLVMLASEGLHVKILKASPVIRTASNVTRTNTPVPSGHLIQLKEPCLHPLRCAPSS